MNSISVGGKWDCLDRGNCTKALKLKEQCSFADGMLSR